MLSSPTSFFPSLLLGLRVLQNEIKEEQLPGDFKRLSNKEHSKRQRKEGALLLSRGRRLPIMLSTCWQVGCHSVCSATQLPPSTTHHFPSCSVAACCILWRGSSSHLQANREDKRKWGEGGYGENNKRKFGLGFKNISRWQDRWWFFFFFGGGELFGVIVNGIWLSKSDWIYNNWNQRTHQTNYIVLALECLVCHRQKPIFIQSKSTIQTNHNSWP